MTSGNFNIQFDYRFDTNGFFNDPNRRAVLEVAANVWENIITDEFANVPIGTSLYVENPQTTTFAQFASDYEIDDLVVFVGARSIDGPGGATSDGGPSATYNIGTSLDTRYSSSNFEPWTGSISFDNSEPWFFDTTPDTSNDIPPTEMDFLSVAMHELGHVLGITSGINAFRSLTLNGYFNGPNAKALNGGNPIPLSPDLNHVQDGFLVGGVGPEALMDPSIAPGVRKLHTPLDVALLVDIGYQV